MTARRTKRDSAPRFHDSAYQSAIASENRFGRIRVAVRRAFIVAGDKPITAREVLVRAYARAKHYTDWQRWSVRRALLRDAIVIGRKRFGEFSEKPVNRFRTR